MTKPFIIAIDGPAASGKSTTARLVAKKLGGIYIDTGAMYRAVTLKCLRQKISLDQNDAINKIGDQVKIEQRPNRDNLEIRTYLDGEDVSEAIRTPEVSNYVSVVSAVPELRERMVDLQRQMVKTGIVVLEGRDIGTVVFPRADLKIFLIASPRERAKRRLLELQAKGIQTNLNQLEREIQERDRKDSGRNASPLKKAADAIEVDTSDLTIDQQVEKVISMMKTIKTV